MLLANRQLTELWERACKIDRSLSFTGHDLARLRLKFVPPQSYSRKRMFLNMARRKISVFEGAPIRIRRNPKIDVKTALVEALLWKLPRSTKNRAQIGPSQKVARLPMREVTRRWLRGRATVGVTDFHIRDTKLFKLFDSSELCFFNTLLKGSDDLATQEMLTMVISSAGNVTDSHSDDTDGTNHCFLGQKLWLAWDTNEGMSAGLQDVERQDVYGSAAFSLSTFLDLRSSRWFLIKSGETLFLPGNLTHKVLTLEPYIGIGNFYVGLPECLDSLTRWFVHGAIWTDSSRPNEPDALVKEVARVNLRLARRLRSSSPRHRNLWGFSYLGLAHDVWKRRHSREARDRTTENPDFRALCAIANAT